MTREPTITYHDFVNALGEPVYAFKVHCHSNAEREARVARAKSGPVAGAYTPFGHAGEAYDPPEKPGLAEDIAEFRKFHDSLRERLRNPPPNCDGLNSGEVLAQAQHEAAEDGEGCGSVACAMTRGVND